MGKNYSINYKVNIMITVGTAHYTNLSAIYKAFGVEGGSQKVKEGLLKVGRPILLPGQRYFIGTSGRYITVED